MISAKQKYVKTYTGKKALRGSEEYEQSQVIAWARFYGRLHPELNMLFHVPNGGARDKREGANLKKAGVLAGIPDLILPVARKGFHHLYIEMKVEPNKPTATQVTILKDLKNEQNLAIVCYGAEQAKKVIRWYLDMVEN
jgi:hypothetical protein